MNLRRAFSLVELLTVMGIIGVLVAILVPVVSMVRLQAKVAGSVQRMQQVVQALSDYAAGDRTVSALQQAAALGAPTQLLDWQTVRTSLPAGSTAPPAFTGYTTTDKFSVSLGARVLEVMPPRGFTVPNAAWWTSAWPTSWPASDWPALGSVPPVLPFPWGRPGLCLDGELVKSGAGTAATGRTFQDRAGTTWGSGGGTAVPVNNRFVSGASGTTAEAAATVTVTRSDGTSVTRGSDLPWGFDLGQCSPLRTVDLLQVAGVLEPGAAGIAAYANDRSPQRPWNDTWGNPLIVVYAVFHPERAQFTVAGTNRRDFLWHASRERYGYAKSVYIAVGSSGPVLRAPLAVGDAAGAPAQLRDRWNQIRDTCRAVEWTEDSFGSPPSDWSSYRKASKVVAGAKETCLLLAPLELKP
jgi:prepilin-type N-terminal cleavage/methylation domain-containing protein